MKAATISEAKSGLSALLDRVRAGESILITDRGIPIARIEPVATSADPVGRPQRLARAGLVTLGHGVLPDDFDVGPTSRPPPGIDVVEVTLDERLSGW